jgi:hypothetical protein
MTKRKVGRNDPCPCGSGKKYKYCCLPRWPELDTVDFILADQHSINMIEYFLENPERFQQERVRPAVAIRGDILGPFVGLTLSSTKSASVAGHWLSRVEETIAELCSNHTRYYWLYLSRRIAPESIEGDTPFTTLLYRDTFTRAIVRYGRPGLDDMEEKPEVRPTAGPLARRSPFSTGTVYAATEVSKADALRIYQIEYICHEFYQITVALRRIWKGGRLSITQEGNIRTPLPPQIQELVRLYDERQQMYTALLSNFGSIVDLDIPRQLEGPDPFTLIVPTLNVDRFEISLDTPGENWRQVKGPMPFRPNYLLAPLSIHDYYDKLQKFHKCVEQLYGFRPAELLCFLQFFSTRELRRISDDVVARYQLLQRGYVLIKIPPELIDELAASQKAYLEELGLRLSLAQARQSVQKILDFLTYSEETIQSIDLRDRSSPKLFLPLDDALIADLSVLPLVLLSIFLGFANITDETGLIKGVDFQDETYECLFAKVPRLKLWLCNYQLEFPDGSRKDIDLSAYLDDILFVVECKAWSVPYEFHRGEPTAIRSRTKRLKKALAKLDGLCDKLAAFPQGKNYDIPSHVAGIVPVICTPFPEYIHSKNHKYFLSQKIPRICTPDELAAFLLSFERQQLQTAPFLRLVARGHEHQDDR